MSGFQGHFLCKASGVELACVRPLRHVRVPTNEKDDVASWSVRSFVLSCVTIECSGCNKHCEGLAVLLQCRLRRLTIPISWVPPALLWACGWRRTCRAWFGVIGVISCPVSPAMCVDLGACVREGPTTSRCCTTKGKVFSRYHPFVLCLHTRNRPLIFAAHIQRSTNGVACMACTCVHL